MRKVNAYNCTLLYMGPNYNSHIEKRSVIYITLYYKHSDTLR